MDVKTLEHEVELSKQAVEDHKKRMITLGEREAALKEKLPGLENAVRETKNLKTKALDLFVSDRISEAELTKARAAEEQAARRLLETIELFDATGRAKERGREELPKVQAELGNRERDLAGHKADELCEQIKSNGVGEKIKSAWVFRLDAGGGGTYEFFLRNLFPMPGTGEVEAMRRELQAK